jgi:hypothetical protein
MQPLTSSPWSWAAILPSQDRSSDRGRSLNHLAARRHPAVGEFCVVAITHRTLGACAVGFRNVLNRPLISIASPVCSNRSHSVARLLKTTRGPEDSEQVASTKGEPSSS